MGGISEKQKYSHVLLFPKARTHVCSQQMYSNAAESSQSCNEDDKLHEVLNFLWQENILNNLTITLASIEMKNAKTIIHRKYVR